MRAIVHSTKLKRAAKSERPDYQFDDDHNTNKCKNRKWIRKIDRPANTISLGNEQAFVFWIPVKNQEIVARFFSLIFLILSHFGHPFPVFWSLPAPGTPKVSGILNLFKSSRYEDIAHQFTRICTNCLFRS